jgi:hypothetical protein
MAVNRLVTVTSIIITLPIGTNAKDLTARAIFQTSATYGWSIAQQGGVLHAARLCAADRADAHSAIRSRRS